MATVRYWSGTWVSSGPGNDLLPGASHYWLAWGFNYGETLTLTAHPVVLAGVERHLAILDVNIEGDGSGRRVYYTVKNVGSSSIPGYLVAYSTVGA